MKRIGAKLEEPLFEKCETVRKQEGLSRSDYVRNALEAYNILHYVKRLTDEGLPVSFIGEPNDHDEMEPSEGSDTCDSDQSSSTIPRPSPIRMIDARQRDRIDSINDQLRDRRNQENMGLDPDTRSIAEGY